MANVPTAPVRRPIRFRLRTLLLFLAVLPPMLAVVWTALSARPIGSTTLSGGQCIVVKTSSLGGVGIADNGKSATFNFGRQTAYVDADQFYVAGGRAVRLPASSSTAELIKSGGDVQIVVDGTPLK